MCYAHRRPAPAQLAYWIMLLSNSFLHRDFVLMACAMREQNHGKLLLPMFLRHIEQSEFTSE